MVGVEGWLDIRRVDAVRKEEGGVEGDSQQRRERENDDERRRKNKRDDERTASILSRSN